MVDMPVYRLPRSCSINCKPTLCIYTIVVVDPQTSSSESVKKLMSALLWGSEGEVEEGCTTQSGGQSCGCCWEG